MHFGNFHFPVGKEKSKRESGQLPLVLEALKEAETSEVWGAYEEAEVTEELEASEEAEALEEKEASKEASETQNLAVLEASKVEA